MNRELTYRLVLAAAVAVVVLAFAPVLEAWAGGPGFFSVLARVAFHRLCHQDPARSLVVAGALLPICARCTGIYLGFLAGWSVRMVRGTDRDRRLSRALLLAGVFPLVLDGLVNWAGLVNTPAAARLATGLLFGVTVARGLWPELLPALEAFRPVRPATARAETGR